MDCDDGCVSYAWMLTCLSPRQYSVRREGGNGEGEMGGEGKKNGMKVWFKNLRYVRAC